MSPLAVIDLTFDPVVRAAGLEVRAQTLALVVVLFAGLLVWAAIGRRTPSTGPYVPPPMLRVDDIPFLVIGIVPGAVVGGRLEAVFLHLDYYAANPSAIVDPAQGSLGLGLAVVGGILGGVAIARLVDASVPRWMHAGAIPLLLVLAFGKLAGVLAAEGQGAPSDLPWATAYHGPGPWASLAPELPSHPSQAYEAIATLIVLAALGLALRMGAFARKDGSALLAALGQWAVARGIVVFTWRDEGVLGPLKAEQLLLLAILAGCVAGLLRLRAAGGSAIVVPERTTG